MVDDVYIIQDMDGNMFIVDDPARVDRIDALIQKLSKQGIPDEQMTPYLMQMVNPVRDAFRAWFKREYQYFKP